MNATHLIYSLAFFLTFTNIFTVTPTFANETPDFNLEIAEIVCYRRSKKAKKRAKKALANLIKKGFDPNTILNSNYHFETLLIWLISRNTSHSFYLVKYLIEEADASLFTPARSGFTPTATAIRIASTRGNYKILKYILNHRTTPILPEDLVLGLTDTLYDDIPRDVPRDILERIIKLVYPFLKYKPRLMEDKRIKQFLRVIIGDQPTPLMLDKGKYPKIECFLEIPIYTENESREIFTFKKNRSIHLAKREAKSRTNSRLPDSYFMQDSSTTLSKGYKKLPGDSIVMVDL